MPKRVWACSSIFKLKWAVDGGCFKKIHKGNTIPNHLNKVKNDAFSVVILKLFLGKSKNIPLYMRVEKSPRTERLDKLEKDSTIQVATKWKIVNIHTHYVLEILTSILIYLLRNYPLLYYIKHTQDPGNDVAWCDQESEAMIVANLPKKREHKSIILK